MSDDRPAPILRVGLTGGIACGKSIVSRELQRLGCYIIDADQIARDIVEPGQQGWCRLIENFGESILLPEQKINRQALGRLIFSDPAKRAMLNAILHPLILTAEEDRIYWLGKGGFHGIVIVEAALMIETGTYENYDHRIVVFCDPLVQLKRLQLRNGLDIEEARRRIESQLSVEEKKKFATHLIDTTGSLRSTHEQVRKIYYSLLDAFLRRDAGASEPLA